MLSGFPQTSEEISAWRWADIEPFYRDLQNRDLHEATSKEWLSDWTHLHDVVHGRVNALRLAFDRNSADTVVKAALDDVLENIMPQVRTAEHELTQKLLASGLQPEGMAIPLQKMRVAAETFRTENLALEVEEEKQSNEYTNIIGAQTVQWEGQELTVLQLSPFIQSADRALREKAWRAGMDRLMQDRAPLNDLWANLLQLRQKIAANAGEASYRDLIWKQYSRFDYTPDDCLRFHEAIEAEVVPAVQRIYARRRARMGIDTVRPWDLDTDPLGRPPLKPFNAIAELEAKSENVFRRVDPQFGDEFATMRRENLLDMDNRKNKASGAYCTNVLVQGQKRPFILMNAVGRDQDVATILHEAGHAFHSFAMAQLPYFQQEDIGSEIAEVASMAMELLPSPYLTEKAGGFFNPADAARYRTAHLENMLLLWPYIAIVDAFQHWAYSHPDDVVDPAQCDKAWGDLWQRFRGGEDWSGLEAERVTGWQRKLHIFMIPFYYIEYGVAQLGAVQIWANALRNQSQAVVDYRKALRLGGTASLPDLYAAAGVRFALDAATLHDAVALIEQTIADLDQQSS